MLPTTIIKRPKINVVVTVGENYNVLIAAVILIFENYRLVAVRIHREEYNYFDS